MPQFDFLANPVVGGDPTWQILWTSRGWMRGEQTAEWTSDAYLGIVHRAHSYDRFLSGQKLVFDELELSGLPATVRLPPPCAWLEFEFKFAKPFMTGDDTRLAYPDNTIRKDPVFRMPVIPGSTWKGCLRSAAVERMVSDITDADLLAARRLQILRLFGDEKGTDEATVKPDSMAGYLNSRPSEQDSSEHKFRKKTEDLRERLGLEGTLHLRGRLHCLPSEAWAVDVDVINRRDNDGKGEGPIYLEVVPPEASSRFSLLYVPLDLFSVDDPGPEIKEDFDLIGRAIYDVFQFTGVGAKRSSGYGLAKKRIDKVQSPWDKVNKAKRFSHLQEALINLP